MAIRSSDGRIVGVLQAINKRDGIFGQIDEDVMNMLSTQAGIALQNANLFRISEDSRDKFRSLLDIIRAMQGEMGVNSLIFTITQRTTRVVDADRCTLFLVDNVHKGLFAMQGEVNIRIPMDSGIAGSVASTGIVANIPDAYENPQFNQAIDKKSGYRTKAILCMPIKSGDEVIGVIQLINKVKGGVIFTIEDEDIMMIFLAIAGPILAGSNLYAQIQGRGKGANEVANEAMGGDAAVQPHKASAGKTMPTFADVDEEDDDS
ncbi:PDE11A [Symbiodinium microadriaticum]|nr:PDE11A [Symbiodinium microadriaticum]